MFGRTRRIWAVIALAASAVLTAPVAAAAAVPVSGHRFIVAGGGDHYCC